MKIYGCIDLLSKVGWWSVWGLTRLQGGFSVGYLIQQWHRQHHCKKWSHEPNPIWVMVQWSSKRELQAYVFVEDTEWATLAEGKEIEGVIFEKPTHSEGAMLWQEDAMASPNFGKIIHSMDIFVPNFW